MKQKNEISDEKKENLSSVVDIGLIVMFLKMTPEERLKANDNAINTIEELRNAFAQRQFRNKS